MRKLLLLFAPALAACDSTLPPDPPQQTATDVMRVERSVGGASEASKIQIGLDLAPVPLDMTGLNPSLVGLGSYIVNVTSPCADCHSNPQWAAGGNPFLGQPKVLDQEGYLRGGSTAFGPFTPRNLTPDRNGRPAGLTLDEFIHVLNTGEDVKGRAPFVPSVENDLLQIMPWPFFGHMPDREKRAVYEYLRSIPCRGSATRCGTT